MKALRKKWPVIFLILSVLFLFVRDIYAASLVEQAQLAASQEQKETRREFIEKLGFGLSGLLLMPKTINTDEVRGEESKFIKNIRERFAQGSKQTPRHTALSFFTVNDYWDEQRVAEKKLLKFLSSQGNETYQQSTKEQPGIFTPEAIPDIEKILNAQSQNKYITLFLTGGHEGDCLARAYAYILYYSTYILKKPIHMVLVKESINGEDDDVYMHYQSMLKTMPVKARCDYDGKLLFATQENADEGYVVYLSQYSTVDNFMADYPKMIDLYKFMELKKDALIGNNLNKQLLKQAQTYLNELYKDDPISRSFWMSATLKLLKEYPFHSARTNWDSVKKRIEEIYSLSQRLENKSFFVYSYEAVFEFMFLPEVRKSVESFEEFIRLFENVYQEFTEALFDKPAYTFHYSGNFSYLNLLRSADMRVYYQSYLYIEAVLKEITGKLEKTYNPEGQKTMTPRKTIYDNTFFSSFNTKNLWNQEILDRATLKSA